MSSKKISQFLQVNDFQSSDLVNIVRNSTNYAAPFSAVAPALGVTGTIQSVGSGLPILEQPVPTSNNIRSIEDGSGIMASISATNGLKISHNFTVNKTGSALIVDETAISPVFRSIVAGSGIAVATSGNTIRVSATAVGASNTVVVNSESDFPTPSGGVITLTDNTNYIIASAISTANRFVFGANNHITANNIFSPVLTYTGTGVMFTGVDVNAGMSNISVNCPNGTFINMSSPTAVGGNFLIMDSVITIACTKYGTVDNLRVVDITNSSSLAADDGLTIAGNTNWSVFSLDKFGLISTSATLIGLDFGASVHQTLEIQDYLVRAPAGAIGVKGASGSANLAAGQLATVNNSEFSGGLTPLDTVTSNDLRWEFKGNAGVANTTTDVLMGFNGNVAETVITIASTPVKVNAVWSTIDQAKMTADATGKAVYNAEQSMRLPVDISIGFSAAGGGSKTVIVYLALNGSVISASGRSATTSASTERTLSIPWQLQLAENDYLEVFVSNETDTTNIVVNSCIMRVN